MSDATAAISSPSSPRSPLPGICALAAYGFALIAAGTLLVSAEPHGSGWFTYGLACEALGAGCVVRATARSFPRVGRGLPHAAARTAGAVGKAAARYLSGARSRLATRVDPLAAAGARLTQLRVIRSEWTKLTSLRSSRIVLAVTAALIVGLAMVVAVMTATRWDALDAASRARFNPVTDLLVGVELAQLAAGVLGVMLISGEYATGMIRISLTAVPTRMPLLRAKLAVLTGAVGGVALLSTTAAVVLGSAALAGKGTAGPAGPAPWLGILGAALYVAVVAVVGLGLGALLRNTAAAIAALVGVFLVVPILIHLLPEVCARWVGPYLPGAAGEALWANPQGWHIGSRAAALVVLIAWPGAVFAAASYRLLRQDV